MNNLELISVIRKDPILNKIFLGVFASNTLPKQIPYRPAALIVNTDTSDHRGEHWVSMYFDGRGNVDYFDSYALDPSLLATSFIPFMKENSVKQNYNNKCIQSLDASVCGMYCIYFLYKRSRQITLRNILDNFNSNLKRNDVIVCNFIYQVFGAKHKVCCSNTKMQTCVSYCQFKMCINKRVYPK